MSAPGKVRTAIHPPAGPDLPEAPPLAGVPAPAALYLHFPFCVHRCHYCDFSVRRTRRPPVDAWLDAVSAELESWFARAAWRPPVPLDTIFVGGGTPSLLGADGMRGLRARLAPWFGIGNGVEWTAEANPASFTPELAAAWRETGVNRVSLGVQSFDEGALGWLGRLHDAAGAVRAVRAARAGGIEDVNADLIFGLPEDVPRDLEDEVARAVGEGVTHVSAYGLTIEPRTPLAKWVRSGRITPAPDTSYSDEYGRLAGRLRAAGFEHYEVSNFARPGHECRHNWYYWKRAPYLGLGPSAHGFLPPFRLWNAFRWDRYRAVVSRAAGALDGWERLSAADEDLERVWLGLRTRKGLPDADWARATEGLRGPRRWEEAGWLEHRGDRVVATVEGWLRMDAMVTEIVREENRD